MDVVVKRADAEYGDAIIQIYYQDPGEIVIEREDRTYDPELARLLIDAPAFPRLPVTRSPI